MRTGTLGIEVHIQPPSLKGYHVKASQQLALTKSQQMKTFIIILIGIAILYLIAREYFAYKAKLAKKREEEKQKEDALEIERIIGGRSFYEVYEELDAKEIEDLTDNELTVLYTVTKWYEENRRPLN